MQSQFVPRLPDNDIGQGAVNFLRQYGVGTDPIVYGGDRIGIYFLEEGAAQLDEELTQPIPRKTSLRDIPVPSGPIVAGDQVYLRSLGKKGLVLSVDKDDVEVQVGNIRVRAQIADLEHSHEEDPAPQTSREASMVRTPKDTPSPGIELDLRGQQVDEALQNLEFYLDKAFLAGLPWSRIIHGMGMGRLRSAIRQRLKEHPQVKSFESGKENEGGDGVTVVTFHQ